MPVYRQRYTGGRCRYTGSPPVYRNKYRSDISYINTGSGIPAAVYRLIYRHFGQKSLMPGVRKRAYRPLANVRERIRRQSGEITQGQAVAVVLVDPMVMAKSPSIHHGGAPTAERPSKTIVILQEQRLCIIVFCFVHDSSVVIVPFCFFYYYYGISLLHADFGHGCLHGQKTPWKSTAPAIRLNRTAVEAFDCSKMQPNGRCSRFSATPRS